jgi:SAM-dependent methyltransferase
MPSEAEGVKRAVPTAKDQLCPSCNNLGMEIFYEVKNVPINSCALSSDYNEAISFPLGDVVLGFCKTCGFISNIAFDPCKVDYSSLAPEEQGFSATFNAFAQKLAMRLIQNYSLRNKHVLEIGCGRGDFLALLCKLGNNYGVGIDPSSVTGDVQSKPSDRLMFIRDFYSERYAKYHADLVCCRHTLEHIHNTAEFVNSLRHAIGDRTDTVVFFEVPDVTRILREVAFWDIYYEHCSYFTLGSLARLFRSCKFEVTNLTKDYFDQYLLLEAKPVSQTSERLASIEERVEETTENVDNFSVRIQDKLKWWKDRLGLIRAEKKRAVVWGSGSKCVAFMTTLNVKDEIEYVVDINPHRHGKFISGVGKQIVPPEFLKKYKPEIVIVMNPAYCNEITAMLNKMDIVAEMIPCT